MMSPLPRRAIAVAVSLAFTLAAAAQTPWAARGGEEQEESGRGEPEGGRAGKEGRAGGHCAWSWPGNGPAAMALSPKPADWTSKKVAGRSGRRDLLDITTGRGTRRPREAPARPNRWALVQHIRSLKEATRFPNARPITRYMSCRSSRPAIATPSAAERARGDVRYMKARTMSVSVTMPTRWPWSRTGSAPILLLEQQPGTRAKASGRW